MPATRVRTGFGKIHSPPSLETDTSRPNGTDRRHEWLEQERHRAWRQLAGLLIISDPLELAPWLILHRHQGIDKLGAANAIYPLRMEYRATPLRAASVGNRNQRTRIVRAAAGGCPWQIGIEVKFSDGQIQVAQHLQIDAIATAAFAAS
jgi:hypothetical protein